MVKSVNYDKIHEEMRRISATRTIENNDAVNRVMWILAGMLYEKEA